MFCAGWRWSQPCANYRNEQRSAPANIHHFCNKFYCRFYCNQVSLTSANVAQWAIASVFFREAKQRAVGNSRAMKMSIRGRNQHTTNTLIHEPVLVPHYLFISYSLHLSIRSVVIGAARTRTAFWFYLLSLPLKVTIKTLALLRQHKENCTDDENRRIIHICNLTKLNPRRNRKKTGFAAAGCCTISLFNPILLGSMCLMWLILCKNEVIRFQSDEPWDRLQGGYCAYKYGLIARWVHHRRHQLPSRTFHSNNIGDDVHHPCRDITYIAIWRVRMMMPANSARIAIRLM